MRTYRVNMGTPQAEWDTLTEGARFGHVPPCYRFLRAQDAGQALRIVKRHQRLGNLPNNVTTVEAV